MPEQRQSSQSLSNQAQDQPRRTSSSYIPPPQQGQSPIKTQSAIFKQQHKESTLTDSTAAISPMLSEFYTSDDDASSLGREDTIHKAKISSYKQSSEFVIQPMSHSSLSQPNSQSNLNSQFQNQNQSQSQFFANHSQSKSNLSSIVTPTPTKPPKAVAFATSPPTPPTPTVEDLRSAQEEGRAMGTGAMASLSSMLSSFGGTSPKQEKPQAYYDEQQQRGHHEHHHKNKSTAAGAFAGLTSALGFGGTSLSHKQSVNSGLASLLSSNDSRTEFIHEKNIYYDSQKSPYGQFNYGANNGSRDDLESLKLDVGYGARKKNPGKFDFAKSGPLIIATSIMIPPFCIFVAIGYLDSVYGEVPILIKILSGVFASAVCILCVVILSLYLTGAAY
ncbi:unnamed protein product [Ambrosiozyma monospora]|uniref:Unnamed protein product n=1 Tax=Ambrosiozyma monospora TaxID=43982 RepID=A0A9W6YXR7_AMBMO|nr:unnamed protein product [Ambrosiozyma monospora]